MIVVAPDPKQQPTAMHEKTLTALVERVQSMQAAQQNTPASNDGCDYAFFLKTKLENLRVGSDRWIEDVNMMSWAGAPLKNMYWRSCYSYILCSVVAGLEAAHQYWMSASKDPNINEVKTQQFVVTGTQGTGKSILCAFLGLVLDDYGWRVNYQYGPESFSFGQDQTQKNVLIWDGSAGGAMPILLGNKFLVMITSLKETQWHKLQQQNSWTNGKGNFIYIDPAPKEEVEAMGKRSEQVNANWKECFKYAGGVPRLCLLKASETKEIIDQACQEYVKIEDLSKLLSDLMENDNKMGPAGKIYPGLIAHFMPNIPFRENCQLVVASSYVGDKLREKVKVKEDMETRKAMSQMLQMPKARSFAGWIWEPFFSKKTSEKLGVTFVGCSLPAKEQPVRSLLQLKSSCYECIEYKDLADFENKVKSNKMHNAIFGKARKDNAAALDGIILTCSPTRVIGIQLCVSKSTHPVIEEGIEKLQRLFEVMKPETEKDNTAAEIWFVQPEECLDASFGFTSLQALTFTSQKELPEKAGSKRKRKGETVWRSNNKEVWSDKAKKVSQYVAQLCFHFHSHRQRP